MSGLYPRLAAQNLKLHRRSYIPYILTGMMTTAVFYILASLTANPSLGDTTTMFLGLGTWVVAIFSLIFLFYTNSFLMKQRKKELGLYNVLGMSKGHIVRVIGFETLYASLLLIGGGLLLGILLDKFMFLLLANLINIEVKYGFHIATGALRVTLLLFGGITVLMYVSNIVRVVRTKPIELLQGANAGEKEPKTKIIMAVLGVLTLGGGYALSIISSGEAMVALMAFFIAVILVIIGTYLLFVAGSIALLKILRRNKGYYYKTQNFISVSGMLYRMKQNAVGLANICILSTMVLVIVSSTFSLWFGAEHFIKSRCPEDLYFSYTGSQYAAVDERVQALVEETPGARAARYMYFAEAAALGGDAVEMNREQDSNYQMVTLNGFANTSVISLETYNAIAGTDMQLADNEAMMFFADGRVQSSGTASFYGKTYQFRPAEKAFRICGESATNIMEGAVAVVPDFEDTLLRYGEPPTYGYSFSLQMDSEKQRALENALTDIPGTVRTDDGYGYRSDLREQVEADTYGMYGSFLFMGVSLGLLFTMAAVLIIYYKQISEGVDDKGRFSIMQKVGLSQKEAKRSIRTQILTVFFLPLITAGIHILFAFPIIRAILKAMMLSQTHIFILVTVVSFLVFTVFYAVVFGLTARTYWRIVNEK